MQKHEKRKEGIGLEYKDITPSLKGQELLRGEIKKNKQIDISERALSERFGISRTAIRRSLATLQGEGLIKKKSRVGTVVNNKHIISMLAMSSMSDELEAGKNEMVVTVLDADNIVIPKKAKKFLNEENDNRIFKLARKRSIKGEPISYEIAFLSKSRFPEIEKNIFENASLYQILKDQYQVSPSYGHEDIAYVPATLDIALILDVNEQTALFKVVSSAYDNDDRAVEYSIQYLIGNRVKYQLRAKNILDYQEDGEI